MSEATVEAVFDKIIECKATLKRKRALALNKKNVWTIGQLAINEKQQRFEIGKVTAKQVEIRWLLPDAQKHKHGFMPAGQSHLDQLIYDCDGAMGVRQGKVKIVDDNFLWGRQTGFLQRQCEVLKPFPTKMKRQKK